MSEKVWSEFINFSAEEFKKKTVGRYYVLSWTPVRSIHNPRRCQVKYRRWKSGDRYTEPIPVAEVVVTKPMGVKIPVVTRREEQVAVAEKYEATLKANGKVEKVGAGVGAGMVLLAVLLVLWYFLFGKMRRG